MNIELSTANLRKLCRICLQQGELNVWQRRIKLHATSSTASLSSETDAMETAATSSGSEESANAGESEATVRVQTMLQCFGKWECLDLQLICEKCLEELLAYYVYYQKIVKANKRLKNLYKEAVQLEKDLKQADVLAVQAQVDAELAENKTIETSISTEELNCLTMDVNNHDDEQEPLAPPSPSKRGGNNKCKPIRNPKFILTGGVSKILTHIHNDDNLPSIATATKRGFRSLNNAQKRPRTTQRERKPAETMLRPLENASLVVTKFMPSVTAKLDHFNAEVAAQSPVINKLRTMDFRAVKINAANLQQIMEEDDLHALLESTSTDAAEPDAATAVYACQHCPQAYSIPECLITHVRKSHVCQYCTQAFVKTADLHEHVKQLHWQHICPICQKELSSQRNLRGHIKRVHGLKLPTQVTLLDYRPQVDDAEELAVQIEGDEEQREKLLSQIDSVDEHEDDKIMHDVDYLLCND